MGLCSSYFYWRLENASRFRGLPPLGELNKQFVEAGLSATTPFTTEGGYLTEVAESRCHLNEHRRQWVIDRIADMEPTE